ncbi:LysR substrate-binding domain-containing protein [Nitrobacteraceae bacterium UC4446_H13]
MRRIPSLAMLRAFDAAARRQHFAEAASELGLTPGAISRQIQQLEAELGVKLFDRNSRAVALTDVGKTYAAEIASALDNLAQASDRIRAGRQHRPLRICAYPTFALRWLIPRWREFSDLHPDIDLQLTTSLEPVDPLHDGFDAVIRLIFPHQFEKNSIVLAPLEIFPICRPSQTPKIRKPPDLRDHTLVHTASRPNDWPRWLRAAGLHELAAMKAGPTFESLNLSYQAAIEGVGIAMGVGCLVEDDLRLRRLVKPLPLTYKSKLSFCMIFAGTRTSDTRVATLRNFLADRSQSTTGIAKSPKRT